MEALKAACPIYADAFMEMIDDLTEVENEEQQKDIQSNFTKKYTKLPKLWAAACLEPFFQPIEKHVEWNDAATIVAKIKNMGELEAGFKLLEEALEFPHGWLELLWDTYRSYYGKPVSPAVYEKYEKFMELYNKMKSCDTEEGNDDERWLEYLKEIDDPEVIYANLKLRLQNAKSCLNKNLWKFYFGFLSKFDCVEILEAYQNYTRLFIGDKEIVEEYRKKLEYLASLKMPTTKFWMDTIQYEIDFETWENVRKLLERAVKAVTGKKDFAEKKFMKRLKFWETKMLEVEKSWMKEEDELENEPMEIVEARPKIHFNNPVAQNLCFRLSMMRYILNKSNSEMLKKLYFASKYLYVIHQVPICYKLKTTNFPITKTFQESLYLNDQGTSNYAEITKRFYIYDELSWQYFFNRNSLAPLIQNFYRCEARKIVIYGQNLKLKELEALLSDYTIWLEFKETEISQNSSLVLDGKQLMKYFETLPNLSIFIYINFVELFCISAQSQNFAARMIWYCLEYKFENIHLENQIINSKHFQYLIQQRSMKNLIFKNTKVFHFDHFLTDEYILEWIIDALDGAVEALIE